MREVAYPTPGEILREEFLEPLGISAYRLAKDIGVPQIRISEILSGKRAITVDNGAPGRTRTCNRRLRRPMLYPVELRARVAC
jgi:antitoxin component HigA of HigAB toxin-antitoxin module